MQVRKSAGWKCSVAVLKNRLKCVRREKGENPTKIRRYKAAAIAAAAGQAN